MAVRGAAGRGMVARTPEWLYGRRDFCEVAFSSLIGDFGYRRCLRRFRDGGFQIGYLGPGAGVLVEWMPRDPVTVLLLLKPGEVPASWGSSHGPRGFDLGFLVLLAGEKRQVGNCEMYSPADDVITGLATQLRSYGRGMLRGDYSVVPAVQGLITSLAGAARA